VKGSRTVFAIAARRFDKRIFGEQTSYLRGLVSIARRHGMGAYVFSPLDVDWERKRVKAYVPKGRGWKTVRRPLPDVVHDRVWGLTPEKAKASQAALRRLEAEFGIPVFNPDFGDKLEVHALLAQDPDLARHLPETLPLSAEAVEKLAGSHRTLFIKPVRGRQGKGITKAERTAAGWKAAKQTDSGVAKGAAKDAEALVAFAARGRDPGEFLVQQGLELARAGRSAVDIRAIVQRDGRGRWRVSAIGARVGRRGGFVSNLHAGGKAVSIESLARRLSGRVKAKQLSSSARALALKVAEKMGGAHPLLGELGLDLGLDKNGKLWILEVNRQPGRALFSRARLLRSWRTSRVRVVQYARYLGERRPGGASEPPAAAGN